MNDEVQLLQAILAAPEDDTLRLAYADCIEELGRAPEAAFIRADIRLAALTRDEKDEEFTEGIWELRSGGPRYFREADRDEFWAAFYARKGAYEACRKTVRFWPTPPPPVGLTHYA